MYIHEKNIALQQAIDQLILNSNFINNMGLYHGKMGISLFFFHLYKTTQNNLYEDFGTYLLEDIYKELNIYTGIGLENGLTGIGLGFTYLYLNGYIETDLNETLEELDQIIIEYAPARIKDMSIENGYSGLILYICYRLHCAHCSNQRTTFPKDFLKEIKILANEILLMKDIPWIKFLARQYLTLYRFHFSGNKEITFFTPEQVIHKKVIDQQQTTGYGLARGLAGKGFLLLKLIGKKHLHE